MDIRIITKASIVAGVPDRWAVQYPPGQPWPHHDGKREKLLALKGTEFTAEQVNEIIGNDSWTKNECDGCEQDRPVLYRIGQEPDYETRWLDLCPACIAELAAAAEGGAA